MKWLIPVTLFLLATPVRAEGVDLLLPTRENVARLRLEIAAEGDASLEAKWGKFLDELFDYVDFDRDGTLSESEAKRLVPLPGAAGLKKDDLTRANFQSACRAAGFTSIVSKVVPATATQLQASAVLFGRLDQNPDGALSKAELARVGDLFKRLDIDEDDALTREEILAATILQEKAKPEGQFVRVSALDAKSQPAATFQLRLPRTGTKSIWNVSDSSEFKAEADHSDVVRFSLPGVTGSCDGSRNDFDGQLASTREFYAVSFQSALGGKPFLETSRMEDEPALQPVAVMLPFADRDGDGKLTPKEVEVFLNLVERGSRCQMTLTVGDPGPDLFALLDADRDGKIDRREASRAAEQLLGNRTTVRREDLARHVSLTLEAGPAERAFGPIRFATPKRSVPSVTPKQPIGPAWYRAMDRNGDGLLTPKEFLGSPDQFAKWDTDRDGLLSASEAEAAGRTPAMK